MFYKVKKEICGKGIKERYIEGQIINTMEIEKLKQDFNLYRYTFYNSMKELKLEYFLIGRFNQKEFVYSILLEKKSKV